MRGEQERGRGRMEITRTMPGITLNSSIPIIIWRDRVLESRGMDVEEMWDRVVYWSSLWSSISDTFRGLVCLLFSQIGRLLRSFLVLSLGALRCVFVVLMLFKSGLLVCSPLLVLSYCFDLKKSSNPPGWPHTKRLIK